MYKRMEKPFCIQAKYLENPLSDEELKSYFENTQSGGTKDGVTFVYNKPPHVVIGFKYELAQILVAERLFHVIRGQLVRVLRKCEYPLSVVSGPTGIARPPEKIESVRRRTMYDDVGGTATRASAYQQARLSVLSVLEAQREKSEDTTHANIFFPNPTGTTATLPSRQQASAGVSKEGMLRPATFREQIRMNDSEDDEDDENDLIKWVDFESEVHSEDEMESYKDKDPIPKSVYLTVPNLHLEEGDITQKKYDVLVNTVGQKSNDLGECGVVSKAFCNKVGSRLQEDFKKSGGLGPGEVYACRLTEKQLPCKALLHLGLENWGRMTREQLKDGILRCIKYVYERKHKYSSIGFPALGTGNLNTPASELADLFLECATRYPDVQVHVVVYKKDKIYEDIERKFQQGVATDCFLRTKHQSNVRIQVADITKVKADVLVNSVATASADLMQTGAVGKAFAAAGGQAFKAHFASNGGLSEGNTLHYAGDMGTLNCRLVVTVSLRKRETETDKVLLDVLEQCFNHAKQNRLKSIAFPTLGCGNLQYPVTDVIECFKKVASKFKDIQVLIVAYQEDDTLKAFRKAFVPDKEVVRTQSTRIKEGAVGGRTGIIGALKKMRPFRDKKEKKDEKQPNTLANKEPRTPAYWTKFPNMDASAWTAFARRQSQKEATGADFLTDADPATTASASQLMAKCWDIPDKLTVIKVQRVENPRLYFDYMTSLKRLLEGHVDRLSNKEPEVHTANLGLGDLHRNVNEYLLFHGVGADVAEAIAAQGLESRFAAEGLFGRGIYLAEMTSKSNYYTGGTSVRTMFIVRALLGDVYVSPHAQKFVRPPCKVSGCSDLQCAHTDFYNSILGKHKGATEDRFKYREFILYENGLCYPLFLVTYTVNK